MIRTDFRIGIQIQLCLSDTELSEYERAAVALNLLFGNGIPDLETAQRGLAWFMNCGKRPDKLAEQEDEPERYSFEYDSAFIWSAFHKVYAMDISREHLHWFQFVALMNDLDGTAFAGVMDIRRMHPSEVDQKRRAEFVRMKRRFELPHQHTEEEQALIDDFLARANQVQEINP